MTQAQKQNEMSLVAREVKRLYLEADIAFPSIAHPITPLGPLLERLPVRKQEVFGLTSRGVYEELLALGAIASAEEFGEASDEPMAGFFYACGCYAWIYVEGKDRVSRKRFSAAHELGHFWLHYRSLLLGATSVGKETLGWRDDFPTDQALALEEGRERDTIFSASTYLQQEREANAFAAELLMPEDVIRELLAFWQGQGRRRDLEVRLAETLLVSRQAMKIRLHSLGITL
jgi:hypothetical protein